MRYYCTFCWLKQNPFYCSKACPLLSFPPNIILFYCVSVNIMPLGFFFFWPKRKIISFISDWWMYWTWELKTKAPSESVWCFRQSRSAPRPTLNGTNRCRCPQGTGKRVCRVDPWLVIRCWQWWNIHDLHVSEESQLVNRKHQEDSLPPTQIGGPMPPRIIGI